ncbi:cyclopropane-fatty-acyl-phospholipid synthase family protein [Accumulibacter sp.]|uniref:SAM-dependent methyltransferase n=1 Tax=Accumulibacter sp. TaxID=2053492 RepID=UPI0025D65451|nr:cyclopropane-fatty-acyl-phospholipid synthase family protein [Accumulibacter sp.]MCM8594179.1 cyclopropane-fatty-acyl-phospholipid synthase family protein [Accumulibacter sp.]MCM8625741.1 cyclopropane-fatty-acyl-phospholipid synthase family protein [Accumulibacter sp.]MDS4048322.1 cyclopropane-fatty-acyl-phospholipid synthase family protein [Accumulibacter sp.]
MNVSESTLRLPVVEQHRRMPRGARALLSLFEGIDRGGLNVRLPDGEALHFGSSGEHEATFEVREWPVFDCILERGDVGLAETWIDGQWQTADLASLLTLFTNNRPAIAKALYGQWWPLLRARLRHLLNANTRSGARRNIIAHYDLGNDFYRLWLDPTMSYSSALFSVAGPRSLASAQLAKYRRVLQRLAARPGQRVLEIGCGWGGFAETAAREAGVEVVGLTLSPAQLAYARERMVVAGVDRQVRIELCDYRELGAEKFDHLVSIEMIEAVGERWWPTYFATIARALAPTGRAVVQGITIRDDLFPRYRRGTDFIQQYIFPGGMLPSRAVFSRLADAAGLAIGDEFAFGRDYARTLQYWSTSFDENWPAIAALGFDERFRRLWLFYLAYCQAGFDSGSTDVWQFELAHAR